MDYSKALSTGIKPTVTSATPYPTGQDNDNFYLPKGNAIQTLYLEELSLPSAYLHAIGAIVPPQHILSISRSGTRHDCVFFYSPTWADHLIASGIQVQDK